MAPTLYLGNRHDSGRPALLSKANMCVSKNVKGPKLKQFGSIASLDEQTEYVKAQPV